MGAEVVWSFTLQLRCQLFSPTGLRDCATSLLVELSAIRALVTCGVRGHWRCCSATYCASTTAKT